MNERIKELANIWANLRAKDDRLGITYTFSEKALEQFAELIVRECADICYNRDYAYGAAYGEQIVKHFGVEE
jgi:hypothetical protein